MIQNGSSCVLFISLFDLPLQGAWQSSSGRCEAREGGFPTEQEQVEKGKPLFSTRSKKLLLGLGARTLQTGLLALLLVTRTLLVANGLTFVFPGKLKAFLVQQGFCTGDGSQLLPIARYASRRFPTSESAPTSVSDGAKKTSLQVCWKILCILFSQPPSPSRKLCFFLFVQETRGWKTSYINSLGRILYHLQLPCHTINRNLRRML